MSRLRWVLREPLVHFLVIGAILFAGISWASSSQRPTVRIDAREIDQLGSYWAMQAGRPPNRAELQGIIRERIDEELLAREALRLGLDKDDLIIRRRLAQKMAFAGEDTSAAKPPTEVALRAYFEANKGRYVTPGRVTLRQIFFSGDRKPDEAQRAALAGLGALRVNPASAVGDPFLLPLTYEDVSPADLEREYGAAFAKAATTAPVGPWQGPVASAYGLHLIRIEARRPAEPAAFEAVRDQVLDAVQSRDRAAANATFLADLRKRYRVVITGVAP